MDTTREKEIVFSIDGGRLCLDFANTASNRLETPVRDKLTSYGVLISWGRQAGAITPGQEQSLLARSEEKPKEAAEILEQAIALREAIYGIFSHVAAGASPDQAAMETLNEAIARSLVHARLVYHGGSFEWGWEEGEGALDRVLWPVARSAADLLTSEQLDRVAECASDDCGWLFMDMSRNHSRRWCDMSDCGNRAKARRFYERKRAAAS